jgi:hypothetical protein
MAQESIRRVWIGREVTEGVISPYLRLLPCEDFKPDAKDERFVPKEYYANVRVRERKSVRVKKHSDISFKTLGYFDLTGWLLSSAMGISTDAVNGSATAMPTVSQSQTLVFASYGDGDTFSLTFDGYTTPPIAYNLALSATTAANIADGLWKNSTNTGHPSVGNAANVTVTGVSGDATGAQVIKIDFNATNGLMKNRAIPTITAVPQVLSGGGTITVCSLVQTLQIYGSPTGGNFKLTPTGKAQSGNIAFSTTGAITATSMQTALNAISGVTGVTVAFVASTTYQFTITFPNTATYSTALMAVDTSPLTGAANGVFRGSVHLGKGEYDHTFQSGNSGAPTFSVVYYDGVSYKTYAGCSVDQMDLNYTVDKALEFDWKVVARMEFDGAPYYKTATTTSTTAVSPGTQTVAPLALTNIAPNTVIYAANSDGSNGEYVYVSSTNTTSGNFVGFFNSAKSGTWNITTPSKVTITAAITSTGPQQTNTLSGLLNGFVVGASVWCMNSDGTNAESVTITAVDYAAVKFSGVFTSTKTGSWIALPLKLPDFVLANYDHPISPAQLSATIGGTNYGDLINAKVTLKQNRNPFYTLNAATGTGMKRATEGECSVSFDLQADLSAYSGSLYQKYIANTAPGALVLTTQDTSTNIGTTLPTFTLTLPNPIIMDGNLNSMSPSVVQQIKGMGALDTSTNTNMKIVATNETGDYKVQAPAAVVL